LRPRHGAGRAFVGFGNLQLLQEPVMQALDVAYWQHVPAITGCEANERRV
jgi:hypothetical protein